MKQEERSQGMMLASSQNLQYYPTDLKEVFRMIAQLWKYDIKISKPLSELVLLLQRYNLIGIPLDNIMDSSDTFEPHINELGLTMDDVVGILKAMHEYTVNFGDKIPRQEIGQCILQYLIESAQYHLINQLLVSNIRSQSNLTNNKNGNSINIIDPFAGEGEWLSTIKEVVMGDVVDSVLPLHQKLITTVANEIEITRYKKCDKDKNINIATNLAFEDLELIEESFGLVLFNPPYGETNNIRNSHHYLEMLTERNILIKNDSNKQSGIILMVLRGDDFIQSSEYISKNYIIKRMYQVNDEEYEKFKQFVLIAEVRKTPLNPQNSFDATDIIRGSNYIKDIVENNIKFDNKFYYTQKDLELSVRITDDIKSHPYENIVTTHNEIERQLNSRSKLDNRNWEEIKELTSLSKMSERDIVKPTPLSLGEVANLISSGLINGRIKTETGEFNVVGGIKNDLMTQIDEDNNKEIKTLYSTPYLNILTTDENGDTILKELNIEASVDLSEEEILSHE